MSRQQRQYVSKLVSANTHVLTAVLVAAAIVNSATLGFDTSVMNGLNILPSYTDYFQLDTATIGLNNAGGWMGQILASLLMQLVPDRFGRKKAILLSACICAIGIILQAAAQNTPMFIVARIIVGLGSQLSSGAAPALLGELLPARNRGFILGIFFSCFYVGSLFASIVSYGSRNILSTWSWRLPSILQIVPSLLAVCLLPFIPESPRWLIAQGKHEHAREVLLITAGETDGAHAIAEHSMNEIELTIADENIKYPGSPWIEIFRGKANLKRLAILITFGVMIELLGNFVVSFYLGQILSQAGVTDANTQLQINVILSCWSLVVAIGGSYMLDVIGRRTQTLGGIAGMIICLYMLGGLIKVYGTSDNISGIYGSIAVIFLFQGCYAFSITPLTSLYPTEISQYKLRATGITIFRFLDSGLGLMASFSMSFAMANLGWKFYIINATYNFIFLIAVWFFWVETKGLSLEAIGQKFEVIESLEQLSEDHNTTAVFYHDPNESKEPKVDSGSV